LRLINLLGDPLLRIRHPRKALVKTRSSASPGDYLDVEIDCDVKGKAVVELVCRRGDHVVALPHRRTFDGSDAAMKRMNADYDAANQDCWAAGSVDIDSTIVRTKLKIPDKACGHCRVRVYVQGEADFAMGATEIEVRHKAEHADVASDLPRLPDE
jgi:hypothetical protein